MGLEFRVKGVNVALGPAIGGLGRVVLGGRNWESFSNDPYLAGQLAAESVKGIQEVGVIASSKHLIANEQEGYRNQGKNGAGQTVEAISSNLDDRTLHEYYLWPFYDAVKAGTGNVMCSFNRVNNSYACQNSKLMNGILKTELGFEGFVVSDWLAQHAGYDSAVSGLDMAMPLPFDFWGSNLTLSVRNGSMPGSRLDDMATRILATWYKMGQDSASFPTPGIGMPFDLSQPHIRVDARNPAADRTILRSAIEGRVLVKNTNKALPLKAPKLLSIYGYDAVAPKTMFPEPGFLTRWNVGFENSPDNFDYFYKINNGEMGAERPSQIAANGTVFGGGGAGAVALPYLDAPFDALQRRAYKDRTTLFWDFDTVNSTSIVDASSDACLVFINAYSAEIYDRPGLHDDFSDAIVLNIAAQCNNTIVVIHNAGIRLVDQFVDHPNVTAIIYAHLPGQESGRVLVSLLYNDENFSGKLPYTVARNESDYGALLHPSSPEGRYSLFPQSDFSEGSLLAIEHLIEKTSLPCTSLDLAFRTLHSTFQIWSSRMSIRGTAVLTQLALSNLVGESICGITILLSLLKLRTQANEKVRKPVSYI